MKKIWYQGQLCLAKDDERILDCLLRSGIDVPFSCRNGICRTCILKNTSEKHVDIDKQAIDKRLVELGYFYPCKTIAIDGLTIEPADPEDLNEGALKEVDRIWEEADYPPPQIDLWQSLAEGNRLGKIIDEFYDRVFEDPVLKPYFHNTTKQRSKEKVYSFYKRIFSGEKCYFGDRPKNAHHWMVISDEIFDHRLGILVRVLKKNGLNDKQIKCWKGYEEHYRRDIVKKNAHGRRIGDIVTPISGFDTEIITEGTMCDGCEDEIPKNTEVLYSLRTGQVYCGLCAGARPGSASNSA